MPPPILMKFANNFEEVLPAFNVCGVDYLIVVFHGYGRTEKTEQL